MMFIGGCGGSTAGGIKVGRVLLLFKILRSEIIASYRPNQLFPLKLNGNNISESLKRQTLLFITLALMTVALGFLIVSLLEPELNMGTSLSAVIATLFSIGPGFSGVGPTENFEKFSEGTKIAFVLFMALGRLEFFAVLALFTPTLWKRY
jgi:trk system potassium uptake protein TrkH